jgi:signal transduction histidine kinase
VAEQNLNFLAEASKVLSSSLNFRRTLRAVTRLAVPRIADWCAVDILGADGKPELLAVAHVDPKKVRWARALRKREPVDMSDPTGLPNALRTGRSEFYPVITDEMIVAAAKDERHLELMRSIGLSSVMIVPLMSNRRAIGAISFVAAESGRHFSPADLAMAEELASRAALAIENARLYEGAQRAIALRDDFIAVASHELKTPVTSMKIYADALRRQAVRRGDEQAERSLVKINEQIDRLTTLIGDLLDVSKIESGRLAFDLAPFDLDALVAEIIDGVQQTAERHRIECTGTIGRSIRGDRERLAQVFTNLLTNAVKYSPGADRVLVRLAATETGAVIEVQDFGIGIDREHHRRIFDRFYRVSSPDEKTFPGLGVGLYVTSEIVRRHDGAITVRSEKGRGSTFRVMLPFDRGEG